jgi:hypothetical protein
VQALLQQIPCAQKPLPHSAAAEHVAPPVLGPHEFMLLQLLVGVLHWALVVQALKHAVPLQT